MNAKTSIGIVIAIAGIFSLFIAIGNHLEYNLTKKQEQETSVLPLCITNNTLGIEGLNKTCWEIYGGPVVN